MGYDRGQMTVHGFRSAASTMLNEMGYNRVWIEMQLVHAEKMLCEMHIIALNG